MNKIRTLRIFDYIKLLFLASIWAGTFIAIEISLESYSFLFISFSRIFLAFLFLITLVYVKKLVFPKDLKTWKILFLASLFNNVIPFSLIPWAQQYINSSTTSIVLASGPFIALILSHFLTNDENFTKYKLLGVLLAFFGILLLLADKFSNNDINAFYAQLAVLIASIAYIISGLLLRKVSHVSSIIASSSMFLLSSIVLFPFMIFYIDLSELTYFNNSFFALIFLALIPTAFASVLRIKIIQSVGVQFMSQVTYLIPLFTIFFSWLIFDSRSESIIYVSLFFVFLGLFIRNIKK